MAWVGSRTGCKAEESGFYSARRFRVNQGLRPMEPKKIPCLRCNKFFQSIDVRTNRLCSQCNNIVKRDQGYDI